MPTTPSGRATSAAWEHEIRAAGRSAQAVVLETVTGASGGATVADDLTLVTIREHARREGIPIIADEVMTGLGRLGAPLTSIQRGLEPDVIVVSKGLGAGYAAIGAVIVSQAIADELGSEPDLGTFGHTMAGNPLAASTALAVLDVVEDEGLLARVRHDAPTLESGLSQAVAGSHIFDAPRGDGFIWALPIRPHHGREWRIVRSDLLERAWDLGIALYPAGVGGMSSSLLIAPPLNITRTDLSDLFEALAILATEGDVK